MITTALDTICAQADHHADPVNGGVVPALHTATTFARNAGGELPAGLRYSRYGSPAVGFLMSHFAPLAVEGAVLLKWCLKTV